jgi:hypothetical protein
MYTIISRLIWRRCCHQWKKLFEGGCLWKMEEVGTDFKVEFVSKMPWCGRIHSLSEFGGWER